ncbi:MAG: hypothetical protein ABH800_01715 [Candidatus Nealsonbacteria bacterium]
MNKIRLTKLSLLILGMLLIPSFAFLKETVEIDFFYSSNCTHCQAEQKFLDGMEKKYPEVIINRYLINNPANQEILINMCKECDVEEYIGLVPLTFVEKEFFPGFDNSEGIGKKIEDSINKHLKESNQVQEEKKFNLLFLGEVNLANYSLPVLAVILGIMDGFNVCSLGALILILGLVLVLRSRSKILLFGGIFILTTALVYGALIGIWYKLFSLLAPYLRLMEIIIGLLGIAGGVYFFRQFLKFKKQGPACEQGLGDRVASKFSLKIKESLKNPKNIVFLLGTIFLFAVLITIVEFPCSAIVPVTFAGILAQSELSSLQYLSYIALFVLFYMLDEIIVFFVAVTKMTIWLTSKKFLVLITLFEAVIFFLLGLYYLL